MSKKEYEFYMYEGNSIMIANHLPKLQKKGWELAGEVATKYGNNHGLPRMIIPLKREIK